MSLKAGSIDTVYEPLSPATATLNMLSRALPINERARTITNATSAASRLYSIAFAPSSSVNIRALISELQNPEVSALDVWEGVLDAYVVFVEKKPERAAIRRAMQALPQLYEINQRDNDLLGEQIALALKARGAREPLDSLRLLGQLLLKTCDAVVDDALSRTGRVPDALRDEIKRMHRSYLKHFVD